MADQEETQQQQDVQQEQQDPDTQIAPAEEDQQQQQQEPQTEVADAGNGEATAEEENNTGGDGQQEQQQQEATEGTDQQQDTQADQHPTDAASAADPPQQPADQQSAADDTTAAPPDAKQSAATAEPTPPPVAATAAPEEDIVAIRFTARPEAFHFTYRFPTNSPAIILYNRLEKSLRVDRRSLRLYWEGRPLAETDVLSNICSIPTDEKELLLLDMEFDVLPSHLRVLQPGEHALRTIDVETYFGEDIPSKRFAVTLAKGYERKPFLGGYRHKKTECEYHHATTQTVVEREIRRDTSNKLSRLTQTMGVARSTQTRRECGTQMPRSDLLVDESYDRVVVAKPYFSAADLLTLQIKKTVKLQAFVRGWRARKMASELREERDQEEAALRDEDEKRKEHHKKKRLEEIERRVHPRSAKDFAVLYNELEAWRLQEVARIKEADVPESEKKIAMQELLKKETKLLQTIDRLQIQANHENRDRRINNKLDKMASAKKWGNQSVVNVETPFTIRARELRDLYNGLLMTGLTVDERLDILLHVKWSVKEFDCPLTRDIVELVDREADLLNRGRKDAALQSLRKRMANLFLQFVETPEFNPEALQFQKVPLEFTTRPRLQTTKK